MEIDKKAQSIAEAAERVRNVATGIIVLAQSVNRPVAGTVKPHADTIVALKAETIGKKDEWETARDALDEAILTYQED